MTKKLLTTNLWFLFFIVGCATETKVVEMDYNKESRVFSKVIGHDKEDLKRTIIVDVRSRFDHEMSRPPRSFSANASDWSLKGYEGEDLNNKVRELQRLLALNGVDPLVQVVILGYGLKGDGAEFLLASTLNSLGVERVHFMNSNQVKEALVAKGLPPLENLDYWQKPVRQILDCQGDRKEGITADMVIGGEEGIPVDEIFKDDLSLKETRFPKSLRFNVSSPGSYWAYGIVLYLREQARISCVQ